jgi:hypothetical protein
MAARRPGRHGVWPGRCMTGHRSTGAEGPGELRGGGAATCATHTASPTSSVMMKLSTGLVFSVSSFDLAVRFGRCSGACAGHRPCCARKEPRSRCTASGTPADHVARSRHRSSGAPLGWHRVVLNLLITSRLALSSKGSNFMGKPPL